MAKETEVQKLQLEAVIDGSQPRKELADVTQMLRTLGLQQQALRREEQKTRDLREKEKKGSEAWLRLQEQLIGVRKRLDEVKESIVENEAKQKGLQDAIGTTALSLDQLRNRSITLRKTLASGLLNNEAALNNARTLQEVEKRIQQVGTAAGRAMLIWEEDRKAIDLNSMSLEQLGLERKRWEEIKNRSKGEGPEFLEAESALAKVEARTKALTDAKLRAAAAWEKDRQGIALNAMTLEQLAMEEERYRAIIASPTTTSADRVKAAQDLALVRDRTEQLTNANRIAQDGWEEQRKSIALLDMTLEQLAMEEERYKRIIADPGTGVEERAAAARSLTLVKDRTEQLTSASRAMADQWAKMRGSINLDTLSIEQLKSLRDHLEHLVTTVPRASVEFDQAEKELIDVNKALNSVTSEAARQDRQWEKMRQGLRLTDMSMEQLEMESRRLKAAMANLNPTAQAAELDAYRRELQAVENRAAQLRSGLGPFGRAFASVKTQIMGATAVLGSFLAGGAIINGFRNAVRSTAQLSDELANIRKSTGLTAEEVKRLNSELKTIDTRTGGTALREIAVGLGQVGEAASKANVQAIDQIVVALGDEFGEDARTITAALSQLRNNLSDIKSGNYAQDVTHIGNALNVLGATGLATAPVVTDIANRIAGVARGMGVTSGQIFGTAAAFQELGINTERGSTAYIKTIQKMAAEPEKFAAAVRSAGIDAATFTNLLNTDIQAALLLFAQGVRKAGASNTEFAAILKELDTDGAGVSELLGKLGVNYAIVEEKSRVATEALKGNSSILQEFAIKNENLAGELAKLGKEIGQTFFTPKLAEVLAGWIHSFRDLLGWIRENRDAITFWLKVILNATVAWGSYRIAVAIANTQTRLATVLTRAYAGVKGVLTGQIKLATLAQQAFNVAVKANPIGLVISAITTVISLFATFGNTVSAAADEQRKFNEKLEDAKRIASDMGSIDDQVAIVDQLSKMQLQNLKKRIQDQIGAQDEYQAGALAAEEKHSEAITNEQEQRNARILELEAELNEGVSQERAFDIQILLDQLRSSESEQRKIRHITNEAITSDEAAANKERLQNYLATIDAQLQALDQVPKATKRTLAEIDQAIKDLKDQQDQVNTNADYARLERQIKALERERDAIIGSSKAAEERRKAEKDLAKDLDAIRERLSQDRMTENARELRQLDVKYADMLEKVGVKEELIAKVKKDGFTKEMHDELVAAGVKNEVLLKLEETYQQERSALIDKQAAAALKAFQDAEDRIYNDLLAAGVTNAEAAVEAYDKAIEIAKSKGEDTTELEKQRYNALLDVATAHYEQEVVAEMQKWDDIIAIAQQAGIDTTQLEKKRNDAIKTIGDRRRRAEKDAERGHATDMKAIRLQQLRDFAQMAQAVGAITASLQQLYEAQADADGKRTVAEEARIRRMALITIAVQTAAAIANGIAQAMDLPWPANLAAAATSVATVISLMAQASSFLNSAPGGQAPPQTTQNTPDDMPHGKSGATIGPDNSVTPMGKDQTGILEGPSHADDGLKVYNPKTGKVVAEFEGGEAYMLLSKQFTNANRDQIGTIMEASRRGLRLNITGPKPAMPNPAAVSQAMRVVHFANGGVTGGSGNGVTFTAGTGLANDGDGTPPWAMAVLKQLAILNDTTAAWPTKLEAYTVLKKHIRATEEYDRLRNSNRVKRA